MKNNDAKNTSVPTAHPEKEPYQYLNPVPFRSLPHKKTDWYFVYNFLDLYSVSTYTVILAIYCLVLHGEGRKK